MMMQAIAPVVARVVRDTVRETAAIIPIDTTSRILGPVATKVNALASYPLVRLSAVILAIGISAALVIAARRVRGGQDLETWLRNFPMTPFRILIGICLAGGFVVFLCVCMALGIALDLASVISVGSFILLQEGLDISMYGVQRKTWNPEASAADAAARASAGPSAPGSVPTPGTPLPPTITYAPAGAPPMPLIVPDPPALPPIQPTAIPGGERGS